MRLFYFDNYIEIRPAPSDPFNYFVLCNCRTNNVNLMFLLLLKLKTLTCGRSCLAPLLIVVSVSNVVIVKETRAGAERGSSQNDSHEITTSIAMNANSDY